MQLGFLLQEGLRWGRHEMKPPDVIYLQWFDEFGEEADEGDEITWCQDMIYDTDIVYIRQGKPPIVPDEEE